MGAISFVDLAISFGINFAITCLFLFLYSLFSVQPLNARVYFTRWFILDEKVRESSCQPWLLLRAAGLPSLQALSKSRPPWEQRPPWTRTAGGEGCHVSTSVGTDRSMGLPILSDCDSVSWLVAIFFWCRKPNNNMRREGKPSLCIPGGPTFTAWTGCSLPCDCQSVSSSSMQAWTWWSTCGCSSWGKG